jgi:hypothetical protein
MNMAYVHVMTSPRNLLGVTRALVGIGSWLAPDATARVFGLDPANRWVTRLFGARELALAGALLAAPANVVAPVAALGAAVDALDVVSGFDERRRGELSTRAVVLGPVGAMFFATLGLLAAREASAAA